KQNNVLFFQRERWYTDKDGIRHKLTNMPNGDTIDVWDGKDLRHNKLITLLSNGDKILVQSWDGGGGRTFHFVTVTNSDGTKVTGEDYGDGFKVTTQVPGVPGTTVITKFDRFGGMWDGQAWVPEDGQNMTSRNGHDVHGSWQDGRWIVVTGDAT